MTRPRLIRVFWVVFCLDLLGAGLYRAGLPGLATMLLLNYTQRSQELRNYSQFAAAGSDLYLEYTTDIMHGTRVEAVRRGWVRVPIRVLLDHNYGAATRAVTRLWGEPTADGEPLLWRREDLNHNQVFWRDEYPQLASCIGNFTNTDEPAYDAKRATCPRSVPAFMEGLACASLNENILSAGCGPQKWGYKIASPHSVVSGWLDHLGQRRQSRSYTRWWTIPLLGIGLPVTLALDVFLLPIMIVWALRNLRGVGLP